MSSAAETRTLLRFLRSLASTTSSVFSAIIRRRNAEEKAQIGIARSPRNCDSAGMLDRWVRLFSFCPLLMQKSKYGPVSFRKLDSEHAGHIRGQEAIGLFDKRRQVSQQAWVLRPSKNKYDAPYSPWEYSRPGKSTCASQRCCALPSLLYAALLVPGVSLLRQPRTLLPMQSQNLN